MRKSLIDKIFFIDKVEATVFIDFGCADGSMIKMLNGLFPEYSYIGYDNNREMLELAAENVNSENVSFYSDWTILLKAIDSIDKKKCLILSSVLHEIEDKRSFYEFLNFQSFDFVAIRDMFLCEPTGIIPAEVIDKLPETIVNHYGIHLRTDPGTLVQAIFKSYYSENIDTEIKEDYFSFSGNDKWLLESHHLHGLVPVFEYHYLLKFWREKIREDFSFDLSTAGIKTHVQLIYEVPKKNLINYQF